MESLVRNCLRRFGLLFLALGIYLVLANPCLAEGEGSSYSYPEGFDYEQSLNDNSKVYEQPEIKETELPMSAHFNKMLAGEYGAVFPAVFYGATITACFLILIAAFKLVVPQEVIENIFPKKERKYLKPSSYIDEYSALMEYMGLSEKASMDQIKKRYRQIVKDHHPDRLVNHSDTEKEQARKRFEEFQMVYERIMEFKSVQFGSKVTSKHK